MLLSGLGCPWGEALLNRHMLLARSRFGMTGTTIETTDLDNIPMMLGTTAASHARQARSSHKVARDSCWPFAIQGCWFRVAPTRYTTVSNSLSPSVQDYQHDYRILRYKTPIWMSDIASRLPACRNYGNDRPSRAGLVAALERALRDNLKW